MNQAGPVRLIDELGRVVLPAEARHAMGWGEKTPVELWVNQADQQIVIKRHAFTCTFCGETDELKLYGNRHICPACQKEIAKL